MRNALVCAVLMALSFNSMAQGTPPAQVEVRFDRPEKFRDASLDGPGYERGADPYVMKSLTEYLQKLGQRYLKPDQQLVIDIRDIDLAGRYEPWHSQGLRCALHARHHLADHRVELHPAPAWQT
jgi:Protein of unknown function (DUF3016).